jgi:hypothetical protein
LIWPTKDSLPVSIHRSDIPYTPNFVYFAAANIILYFKGDFEKDASAVRLFLKDGHQIALAQSFAKNMGLYGE